MIRRPPSPQTTDTPFPYTTLGLSALGPKAPRATSEGIPPWLRALGRAIVVVYLIASVVLPVSGIVIRSLLPYFSGTFGIADFSLDNLRAVLGDRDRKSTRLNSSH